MPLLANINVGTNPNDGTGDSIRDSFIIVNENFQFIESFFPNTSNISLVANITSTGLSTFNNLTANTVTVSNINVTALGTFNNVTANSITVSNISANVSGNLTGTLLGNVIGSTVNAATIGNSGATLTGTLSTAAQTNITSLGVLTGLTLSGAFVGTSVSAATIGNANSSLVGTLTTANQSNITGLGALTGLSFGNVAPDITGDKITINNVAVIVRAISPVFGTNIALANLNFTSNLIETGAIDINTNVIFNFDTITKGITKTVFVKNLEGSTQYIILPNTNNNKGSNTIPVAAGTTTTIFLTSVDSTAANVVGTIINT